eukprot:gb/GFBE01046390.1/.p1 GENE.gb/GFBE01046390.1/~~gb/GFBE01046390.1/.p1  ORF type:complete len:407 (+),score=95.30 gb/GFBE01046390.1/:1-1221(+)
MGAALSDAALCCSSRDDVRSSFADAEPAYVRNRHESWNEVADADEFQTFFDCCETAEEMLHRSFSGEALELQQQHQRARKVPLLRRLSSHDLDNPRNLALELVPEEVNLRGGQSSGTRSWPQKIGQAPQLLPEDVYEHLVLELTESVRSVWRQRVESGDLEERIQVQLKEGFPELDDWTNLETVRRMLRASNGNIDQSKTMLVKAIACRVRERELFRSLHCKVACDMRIIGRDKENRPTIYMCARSQNDPIRNLIPQVFVAFEAATRLAMADGQAVLVADMHQLQPRLNMDAFAFRELADNFGVVFADRLKKIIIVDFSFLAQAVWSLLKPILSERTQNKINFLSEAKARSYVAEHFGGPTSDRILSAFDINRDKSSSAEDRALHARRTSICDVPLGGLRSTDEAG